MFEQSPFTGSCPYATLEVFSMLIGTLLLGLLLGYLIWGWLKVHIKELERQIKDLKSLSQSNQDELANALSMRQDLEEEVRNMEGELRSKEALYISALQKLNQTEQMLKAERAKNVAQLTRGNIPAGPMTTHGTTESTEENATTLIEDSGTSEESLQRAALVFGKKIKADDLKIIEGIGPKIEQVLHNGGIRSWSKLAEVRLPVLRVILEEAGPQFQMHKPKTWPVQARMAARGEWKKLQLYQEKLVGGREPD